MIFFKRIWEYFFPPKRIFYPNTKEEKSVSKDKEIDKQVFFEPISPRQIFDKSKNIDDFLKNFNEIKR